MPAQKLTVFIATSVDGFIARLNDSVDFLDAVEPLDDTTVDFGWSAFWPSVDALLMGRHTYEVVVAFDEWHYGDTPVYVATSHPEDLEVAEGRDVRSLAGTPHEMASALGDAGFDHVYIDGGVTVQRFLRAGLINRIVLTTIPILIGEGVPLFGALDADIPLVLESVESWENGMVQRTYARHS